MQKTPKISFVCPSFNHEKYVKYFINSVLSQTIDDFELIIVDDCSTDNNVNEIKKYPDKRIKLICHKYNSGINSSLNDAINIASGELISFIASDDILVPNYIEEVLKIFNEKDNDVLYVSLNEIDENGIELNRQRIFDSSKSKYEYLFQSFMGENPLPSPGMVFKKEIIQKFLPLPCGMFQYSDWDLNNKLLLNFHVEVCELPIVNYRVSSNSVSSRSEKVLAREDIEAEMLLDNFLKNINLDSFRNIFSKIYSEDKEIDENFIPYFFSLYALKSNKFSFRKWGYKNLMKLVYNKEYFNCLNERYNLNFGKLISLCPVEEKEIEIPKKNYIRKTYWFNVFLVILSIILGVCLWIVK